MNQPTLATFMVATLAAYRLARLVAWDTITGPARAKIFRWAFLEHADRTFTPKHRLGVWVYGLMSCPFCVGFWFSGAAWFALNADRSYRWADVAWWLAVAGAQSFLTALTVPASEA